MADPRHQTLFSFFFSLRVSNGWSPLLFSQSTRPAVSDAVFSPPFLPRWIETIGPLGPRLGTFSWSSPDAFLSFLSCLSNLPDRAACVAIVVHLPLLLPAMDHYGALLRVTIIIFPCFPARPVKGHGATGSSGGPVPVLSPHTKSGKHSSSLPLTNTPGRANCLVS